MVDDPKADVILWTDASGVSRIERILQHMGNCVRPIGIGGPRAAQMDDLARRLGCDREDDFRKLLVDHPAEHVLLGSIQGISPEDFNMAIGQGTLILSSEPIASDLSELIPPKTRSRVGIPTQGRVVLTPAFIRLPTWTSATEPELSLGKPELISIQSFGTPEDCSLFAKLFDAWQIVLTLGHSVEEIDASLTGPLGEIPENLRGMTGHLGAHARLTNGCTAVLSISDRAGPSIRLAHIVADQGHLHATDTSYEIFNQSGDRIDYSTNSEPVGDFAQLVANDWKTLIRSRSAPQIGPPGPTKSTVLACCLACLLSARTGHAESPSKLLKLHHC